MKLTPPITARLGDENAERVRRNHEQRLAEFAAAPAIGMFVTTVTLANNTETFVSHRLGREPRAVLISPPRGATTAGGTFRDFGTLSPVTGATVDRSQSVLLRTDGFGASITVDIVFL